MVSEIVTVIRAILGFIFVFFVPGFVWTLVFIIQLKILERIALSVGISIAIVALSILAFSLVGVRINTINSIIIIFVISAVPLLIYVIKRSILKKRQK